MKSDLDPDTDGIPSSWEWKWGYDPMVWDDHKNLDPDVDGLENTRGISDEEIFCESVSTRYVY